jgi:predicted transposase YbfD/YdcC
VKNLIQSGPLDCREDDDRGTNKTSQVPNYTTSLPHYHGITNIAVRIEWLIENKVMEVKPTVHMFMSRRSSSCSLSKA